MHPLFMEDAVRQHQCDLYCEALAARSAGAKPGLLRRLGAKRAERRATSCSPGC